LGLCKQTNPRPKVEKENVKAIISIGKRDRIAYGIKPNIDFS